MLPPYVMLPLVAPTALECYSYSSLEVSKWKGNVACLCCQGRWLADGLASESVKAQTVMLVLTVGAVAKPQLEARKSDADLAARRLPGA